MTASRPPSPNTSKVCAERALESAELVVERDADRLERARGGMDAGTPRLTPRVCRDERRQLPRRRKRRRCTRADDRGRDLPSARLFAVTKQNVDELLLRYSREPLGSRRTVGAVHAHVQRSVVRETEAARRFIQLRRRDPKVEQNPGQSPPTEPWLCDCGELLETGVLDPKSRIVPKPIASVSHRVRVFVQSE